MSKCSPVFKYTKFLTVVVTLYLLIFAFFTPNPEFTSAAALGYNYWNVEFENGVSVKSFAEVVIQNQVKRNYQRKRLVDTKKCKHHNS